jgi:hypothetical protein
MRPSIQLRSKIIQDLLSKPYSGELHVIIPPLLPFVCHTLKWWWCLTMRAKDVGDSRPLTNISFINGYDMWSQRYFPVIISSKAGFHSGHAHNKIKARKFASFLKILCLHHINLGLAIDTNSSSILLLFICAFQDGIYCPFSQLQRPSGHQTR